MQGKLLVVRPGTPDFGLPSMQQNVQQEPLMPYTSADANKAMYSYRGPVSFLYAGYGSYPLYLSQVHLIRQAFSMTIDAGQCYVLCLAIVVKFFIDRSRFRFSTSWLSVASTIP